MTEIKWGRHVSWHKNFENDIFTHSVTLESYSLCKRTGKGIAVVILTENFLDYSIRLRYLTQDYNMF
jgi:hypothetical protein